MKCHPITQHFDLKAYQANKETLDEYDNLQN